MFDESLNSQIQELKSNRKKIEIIWDSIEKNYEKQLVDDIILHLGHTERVVDTYTRFISGTYNNNIKTFVLNPQERDDIVTAEAIEKGMNWYFPKWLKHRQLKSVIFDGVRLGTAWAQVMPSKKQIRWIDVKKIWYDDTIIDIEDIDTFYVEHREMKMSAYLKEYELPEELQAESLDDNEKVVVGEHWTKEDMVIKCKRIVNRQGRYYIIDEKKISYWMGLPFVGFTIAQRIGSSYGKSISEKIQNGESIDNKLFNMLIEYLAKFTKPSMWFTPTLQIGEDVLQKVRRGRASGIFPVGSPNSIGYINPPPIPPTVIGLIGMFTQQIEQTAELLDIRLGGQTGNREPQKVALQRMNFSNEPIQYVQTDFEEQFILRCAQKVFLCIFQYFDKDKFIRITGDSGKEWLNIKKGKETKYNKNNGTLTIKSNKERFLAYEEDMSIEINRGQRAERLQGMMQYLSTMFGSLVQYYNPLVSKVDYEKLFMGFMEELWGVDAFKFLKTGNTTTIKDTMKALAEKTSQQTSEQKLTQPQPTQGE